MYRNDDALMFIVDMQFSGPARKPTILVDETIFSELI